MRILVTGGSGFIGTSLVEVLQARGHQVFNLDVTKPLDARQAGQFIACDIMDAAALNRRFQELQPNAVIHLAARADVAEGGAVEVAYAVNITGTRNLLAAVKGTPSVERVIVTSTQYVCRPGHTPANDEDFNPHTLYGESKVLAERATRAAGLPCVWTIIRPTTVWGPWHFRYRDTLFRMMRRGLYVHPSGHQCVQGFGYAKNVARQLESILLSEAAKVHQQVLYIGDGHIRLLDWVNAFSRALRGREVVIVPRLLLQAGARFGDAFQAVTGRSFPLYSARFRNMTDDYLVPMDRTLALLGPPITSLEEGVRETVDWLQAHPGD
jgi:nucleoside-diphosphate-sugar epimerase